MHTLYVRQSTLRQVVENTESTKCADKECAEKDTHRMEVDR